MKRLDIHASIAEMALEMSPEQWRVWSRLNEVDLPPKDCRAMVLNSRGEDDEAILASLIEAMTVSFDRGVRVGGRQSRTERSFRALWDELLAEARALAEDHFLWGLEIDWPRLSSTWLASLEPFLIRLIQAGLERVEFDVSWDEINEDARAWASAHAFELVDLDEERSVLRTTREFLGKIAEDLESGELDWAELVDALEPVFGPGRSRRIAETEITRAFTTSGRLAAKASGMETKTWLTARDELVCKICGSLDGVTVPIDEPYPGGLEGPPAHPFCRCNERYGLEEE